MKPGTGRWGTWASPLGAADVATAGTRLYQPRRRGETFWWVETRPAESGRTVLVRSRAGRREDLNPPPLSVRSRVLSRFFEYDTSQRMTAIKVEGAPWLAEQAKADADED